MTARLRWSRAWRAVRCAHRGRSTSGAEFAECLTREAAVALAIRESAPFAGIDALRRIAMRHPLRLSADHFASICGQRCIAPALALECDAVRDALRRGDADAVKRALDDSF